jgi:hypothetical protein
MVCPRSTGAWAGRLRKPTATDRPCALLLGSRLHGSERDPAFPLRSRRYLGLWEPNRQRRPRLRWVLLDLAKDGELQGMDEDNVRFVILLIIGIVVAGAVFAYFLFMSELHIG